MPKNSSLEESISLLFDQETRGRAVLEEVTAVGVGQFVLFHRACKRFESLHWPSRVCSQANNRLNSAWISLTCPHIVATSPRQTVGPHVPPARYELRSRPFISAGYPRFTSAFPPFISHPPPLPTDRSSSLPIFVESLIASS